MVVVNQKDSPSEEVPQSMYNRTFLVAFLYCHIAFFSIGDGDFFILSSDKETFLHLNIKVIGSDVYTSVYDKRNDFEFPIVNFPWLSVDVHRLPSYGVYISQLVRLARCCTSVSDFHSKNLQITSKLLTQGYIYHKLRNIWTLGHTRTLTFCLHLARYRFKNMFRKESITRPSTVI